MKIVGITHWRIPSEKTMAPYMMRVMEAFAREGAEVEFWAPRRVEPLLKGVDPFEYHAIERNFLIKKLPVLDIGVSRRLGFYLMLGSFMVSVFMRILFSKRRDTVYYFFDLRDAYLAHLLSKNTFCEIHMYYRSSLDGINRRGFRRMAGVIAATKALRTEIARDYGVPDSKMLHAPCGVNFERFGIETPQREARMQLGLPQEGRIILYVGHLFPVKGVDTLFDTHTMLKEGETIYFVGGTDEDIARFKKKWEQSGSPKNVVVAGRKPHQEIPLWLRAADILSIPNTAKEAAGAIESSPSKLIEYMASGVPIIASDVPGITDVMDGAMGYLAEPDSAGAIAEAVQAITANPAEAAARAARAREAAKGLSWEGRARSILGFIQSVIAS
jgi:glycosyltransferase involved in cell wall biosynthesis